MDNADHLPPRVRGTAPTRVTYLVLAKAPVPGAVKTRLTPAYSEHEAAALAAAALLDTLDTVSRTTVADAGSSRQVCALAGDLDAAAAPEAVRGALDAFVVIGQRGDGLGPRLAHAHTDAAGPTGATVQIGMDTPQVTPALLQHAATQVRRPGGPDALLGPAEDGGWWLLALRHAADARVLAGVPMSTPDTGRLTRRALERVGLTVELAPPLLDVDDPADVARVAAAAPGTRFAALAATLGVRLATR